MDKKYQMLLWKALKGASEFPKETQFEDLPGMFQDTLDTKYDELRGLKATDIGGGLLGMYLKNKIEDKYGDRFKISQDSLTYKPSNTQSYYLKHKPGNVGNVEVGAKFNF